MITRTLKILLIKVKRIFAGLTHYLSKKYQEELAETIPLKSVMSHFPSLEKQYMFFHHTFWHKLPSSLIEHREYFKKNQRGFGEDAFHAMWYELIREYRPKNMIEIGVYRGQVISLWTLIAKEIDLECEIHGISPFTSVGDEVSSYISNINYYEDVLDNFKYFSLKIPSLHKGLSTDEEMIEVIKSREWDLIYIDGSHDYEVVKSDFEACSKALSPEGIIVMDDSAFYNGFKPPAYSSKGHPGPSRLTDEIDRDLFKEVLSVGHNRVFQKQ